MLLFLMLFVKRFMYERLETLVLFYLLLNCEFVFY